MNGLAGVMQLDGLAPPGAAERLMRHMPHRADDAAASLTLGPLAAVAPFCAVHGATGIALDGHLHNRADLTLALHLPPATPDHLVMLAAYDRWGIEMAARLSGPFAFVLWDATARRLFAARDVMGARPFCYRHGGRVFAWASEPQALAREAAFKPDEGYLAELLGGNVTSVVDTLFEGVKRLPAGHALTISAGAARTWRYWLPACEPIGHRSDADYVAEARVLVTDAVRGSLAGVDRAVVSLSSGIDSCAIAAAAALVRAGSHAAVTTLTVAFPGHPQDEARRASEVAAGVGVPWAAVPASDVTNGYFADDARRYLDLPEAPNAATSVDMRHRARVHSRVLLSGVGGDEWFFGSDGTVSDLIASGRFVDAGHWLRAARRAPDAVPLRRMLWWGLWRATPPPGKRLIRSALRRPAVPAWVAPAFAARTDLRDRLRAARPIDMATHGASVMFEDAMCGEAAWRRESGERIAAAAGLQERYPYGDRRLIEFAFRIPDRLRYRDGRPKWIVRRAFADGLPGWMADVPASGDFSWLLAGRLERLGGCEALLRSPAVRRGWIDATALRSLYRTMQRGHAPHAGVLWNIFAVGAWLDAVETASSAVAARDTPVYDTRSAGSA